MNPTRRDALATIGTIALGGLTLANPPNQLLTITYKLDRLTHNKTFDLAKYQSESDMTVLHDNIWHELYFKNGNASGVYHHINYQGKDYDLPYADDLLVKKLAKIDFSPSKYSRFTKEPVCQFECSINERYSLRMNRFWIMIDDNVKKQCRIGSGQTDSGSNGHEWLKVLDEHGEMFYYDDHIRFKPTTRFAQVSADGKTIDWVDKNGNPIPDPFLKGQL
jgi:hypothetical protein